MFLCKCSYHNSKGERKLILTTNHVNPIPDIPNVIPVLITSPAIELTKKSQKFKTKPLIIKPKNPNISNIKRKIFNKNLKERKTHQTKVNKKVFQELTTIINKSRHGCCSPENPQGRAKKMMLFTKKTTTQIRSSTKNCIYNKTKLKISQKERTPQAVGQKNIE